MASNIHDTYEQLCLLKALGLLSGTEEIIFAEHFRGCPQCQQAVVEYQHLREQGIAEDDLLHDPVRVAESADASHLKERVLLRARAAGILLRLPATLLLREAARSRLFQATTILLVLMIAGLAAFSWQRNLAASQAQREAAHLAGLVEQTQLRIEELRREGARAHERIRQFVNERDKHGVLYEKLVARERRLSVELASVEQKYSAEIETNSALTAQLERAKSELSYVVSTSKNQEQLLAKQKNVLAEVQANLSQQRESIQDSMAELRKYKTLYDQSAELLAASKDIRDLIGAKDLRIVDVMDVPGAPATATSLGRMFIADQRVLVFYAFDLPESKQVLANAKSYQAWGYDATGRKTYRNLGLFYQDGDNHRWVLHFADPEIIREISAVFVTVEPPGGSARPSGRQLLYAMVNKANWGNLNPN